MAIQKFTNFDVFLTHADYDSCHIQFIKIVSSEVKDN